MILEAMGFFILLGIGVGMGLGICLFAAMYLQGVCLFFQTKKKIQKVKEDRCNKS